MNSISRGLSLVNQFKNSSSALVESDIVGTVFGAVFQSECDDLAGEPCCKVIQTRYVGVDYQHAVLGEEPGVFAEGLANVVQIFEKVQVVCVNV